MASQNSSDDEVSNSPLNRKMLSVKKKYSLFLVGDSSPFIGLGSGYLLDNLPLFHRVRSVQFDFTESGAYNLITAIAVIFVSKLPCPRPKCCLDER